MAESFKPSVIAHIRTDFKTKFGIPRQSGLVDTLPAYVVMEPAYRQPEAFRGLADYDYLWLVWQFSEVKPGHWSPTVRPPRLGGNQRMGVFATRSPFRPNPIGLSSVRLGRMLEDETLGMVLEVFGADLMDGTPILDIKPYLPFTDSHPDARGGFSDGVREDVLSVEISDELIERVPADRREGLLELLKEDPRPSYQNDPERIYGFSFAGLEIRFRVEGKKLMVCAVEPVTN